MSGRFVFRLALAVLAVATLVGLGVWTYDAGVAQGLTQGTHVAGQVPVTPSYPYGPYGYYGHWGHPFGVGFGFLHILFPILFFLLIFSFFRAMFWGRHGGWHGGYGDRRASELEAWHQRMHETQSGGAQSGQPEAK